MWNGSKIICSGLATISGYGFGYLRAEEDHSRVISLCSVKFSEQDMLR